MPEICICGLVETAHPSSVCLEFEAQGLLLNTVDMILGGNGIKPEHIKDPVVIERSMLTLLRDHIINLRKQVRTTPEA